MSMLSSLFGDKKNPMDDANEYLNKIPGVAHDTYDFYGEAGKDASGKTKDMYEQLMNDPTGFMNKLMEGYKQSDGYNFQKDQLTKEMGNTAAAGGIAGTPQDQMNQASGIQGLLGKDMQQYLQNAFGAFQTGLGGEEGIATRGYDANKSLGDILGSALNQQGGLAFQNAQQNNKNINDRWGMFGKGIGGALGTIGGPIGTAIGSSIGKKFFGGG